MDPMISELRLFSGQKVPEITGMQPSTEDLLRTSAYSALFSIVMNTFGGDWNTFGVPDLQNFSINKQKFMFLICTDRGLYPVGSGDDLLLGQIYLFPKGARIRVEGLMPCEGQMLSVSQYTDLFEVIGTRFGGEGTGTFALPDLREGIFGEQQDKVMPLIAVNGVTPEYYDSYGGQFISEVRLFAFDHTKYASDLPGWIPCDGRELSVVEHQALHSRVGYMYGGQSERSFAMPTLDTVGLADGKVWFGIAKVGMYPV